MKLRKLLLIASFLLIYPIYSQAGFSGKDNYTWYGTTADIVTVAWDAPVGYISGDRFEIQIKNPERNIVVNIPETTALTKTFKCPKVGHWIVYVRSKRQNPDLTWDYSGWADSTDSMVSSVNNQPRAWWLYVWLAGPGPIF